jgi:branched-chain amino acid transport system substrate-binding protein
MTNIPWARARFWRRSAIVVAAVALALPLAACGSSGDSGSGSTAADSSSSSSSTSAATEDAATGDPVKIGVLLPYTGAFGLYGKPMEAALRARFAAADNSTDGRKIELVFEDEATDPGIAVTKATKLVEKDGVAAIVCCASGSGTLAVGPVLAEQSIPQIGPIPNPAGLSKYSTAAVAAPTAAHDATKLGEYAASTLGYHTAFIAASDFSYGHEVADGFTEGFTAHGGTIVNSVYAPLGTSDFASYLSQIEGADVTFAGFAGADAIKFVQQYDTFGVKARIPLIGHGPLLTELVLNQIGDAAVGVGGAFYYSSSLDNPANQEFLAALKATGQPIVASHFTAGAWATGGVLLDAIHRVGDKVTDGAAFAEAIRATSIEAPWGTLKFDPDTGYAIAPTYYYTVAKNSDGTLAHKVVEQIE